MNSVEIKIEVIRSSGPFWKCHQNLPTSVSQIRLGFAKMTKQDARQLLSHALLCACRILPRQRHSCAACSLTSLKFFYWESVFGETRKSMTQLVSNIRCDWNNNPVMMKDFLKTLFFNIGRSWSFVQLIWSDCKHEYYGIRKKNS